MSPMMLIPAGSGRRRATAGLAASLVLLLAGTLAATSPAHAAGPAAAAGAAPLATVQPDRALGRTHTVTLLTGDVVALHVAPDGRQAAWVQRPAESPAPATRPAQIYEQDGQVHVVPSEAIPYVDAGVLDRRLFNLSYLARHGYDDLARPELPLLVAAPEGSAEPAPAVPAGARKVGELESIDAISVTVDKARVRSTWEALRGPEPAELGATDAELVGAGTVWLNGRVQAALGESVPQVGAPVAWRAGLDGDGVPVAVLDTGYDPTHPDLAGQVDEAENFTPDPDPPGRTAVDGHGHGTHVAATVAGTGDAAGGARPGVAPGADLLVGKVLNNAGAGLDEWVIAGMEWAVEQGAQVVNMSIGTPFPTDGTDPLSLAVDRLTESSGTLFVVAAGNAGPQEQSVSAPGAATRALTVGATTKDDQAAWFSSRGPRIGDLAVKPEIVAPGVDIVAARAAGTSLGNLLDEHYTSLNGTSMATPHVAGAAAILAQQHPDWDADELKARLVSTSLRLPDEPVNFQGAGRLDVAAAVSTPVTVDTGALSFGRMPQDADRVTRTVTYHNPSGRLAVLRLSPEVTGTGVDDDLRPALRVWPPLLVVRPGGQASVEVTLTPRRTQGGGYAGNLVARDLLHPSTVVHTVTAFTVEGPLRTLTVTGVDRNGQPARGPVNLWSAETGQQSGGFMHDGTATIQVPEGLYAMSVTLEQAGGSWPPASVTVAGDPDLTIRRDATVHFDARDGQPVRVDTDRPAELDALDVVWRRQVGDRSISWVAVQSRWGTELYALPSDPARTGSFDLSTNWTMGGPQLTVDVPGPDGFRVDPPPWFADVSDPYVGQGPLPVVDAGLGTPEDFAGLDAEGKLVLVTRRGEFLLHEQVAAAEAAGAAMLLGIDDRPGLWREFAIGSGVPTYLVDQDTGAAIRAALAESPEPVLDLTGLPDTGYGYFLTFREDRFPGGRTYRAADHPMATVESDYRAASERMNRKEMWVPYVDGMVLATGMVLARYGPVVRTEQISATGVQWQRFAQPHQEFPGLYWTSSDLVQYQPGQSYQQLWWGPLTPPGVPPTTGFEQVGLPVARFRDAIRIVIDHYLYDSGVASGTIYEWAGDHSELTLRRDGEVVGKSSWPQVQFTVPPEEGELELELVVTNGPGNFTDLSVHTESTWRFRSARPEADREVLPLVQVGYRLPSGPRNEVPAGTAYPLLLHPGYQPGATGPGGFTVEVETSYDDGATWTAAPVAPADDGMVQATLPAAPAEAEFGSVRVVATDADGNRLTQLIERGWRIG